MANKNSQLLCCRLILPIKQLTILLSDEGCTDLPCLKVAQGERHKIDLQFLSAYLIFSYDLSWIYAFMRAFRKAVFIELPWSKYFRRAWLQLDIGTIQICIKKNQSLER